MQVALATAAMKRRTIGERYCALARGAGQLVDAWTFLVLRELFLGNRRFEGIRQQTGMSPRSLALRLAKLADEAVVAKAPCKEAPGFFEYRLTAKGIDLWPVLIALRQWGDRWAGPWDREGPPVKLMHRGHDHELRARMVCATCGEAVDARSGEVVASRRALRERAAMADGRHATSTADPPGGGRAGARQSKVCR